jgi:hypothetical protein
VASSPAGLGVVQGFGKSASALAAWRRFAEKLSVYSGRKNGKEKFAPFPFQYLTALGACGKPPVVSLNRQPKRQNRRGWE